MIRLLIVDDEPGVRVTLQRAFSRQADFEVVGAASNGEEGVVFAQALAPDMIIMDVQMPGMSGVDATARLRRLGVSAPVLFLTADATMSVRASGLGRVQVRLKAGAPLSHTIAAARAFATEGHSEIATCIPKEL